VPDVHLKAELLQCFHSTQNIFFPFPTKATKKYTFAPLQKAIFSLKSLNHLHTLSSTCIFLRDSKMHILTHKLCFCQAHCNIIVIDFVLMLSLSDLHILSVLTAFQYKASGS